MTTALLASGNPTYRSGSTSSPIPTASGGILLLPKGYSWSNAKLKTSLLINTSSSPEGWEVTTHLQPDIPEYGLGNSEQEAVRDLLTSLSEYLESLEERQHKLGPPAMEDLESLRSLILLNPTD